MKLLAPLVCLLGACGQTLEMKWPPPPLDARATIEEFPDAPAVILEQQVHMMIRVAVRASPLFQRQIFERRQILGEGGFKYAEVKLPLSETAEVVQLRARSIAPDGQVHELDAMRVLKDEVRAAARSGGGKTGFRIFRFPDVKVGSVLEYVYTTEDDHIPLVLGDRITQEVPIVKYRLQIDCYSAVDFSAKAYNAGSGFRKVADGDVAQLILELGQIPAARDEALAPPWELYEPWWIYRTKAFVFGEEIMDRMRDWPLANAEIAELLYLDPSKALGGARPSIDERGCDGPRCLVARALAFVGEKTELSGFSTKQKPRPLKEVLASARATTFEKAILLWHTLEHAGVAARFALVSRRLRGKIDPEFPSPRPWDHVILYVPKQPGLDPPLWIDPSCEACSAGQIPAWDEGAVALVLFARSRTLASPEITGELKPVEGERRPTGGLKRTYQATIDDKGDLVVAVTLETRGSEAVDFAIRTRDWLPQKWREDLEQLIARRSATARLVEESPGRCDRRTAVCSRSYKFTWPGYATVDGDRLLVPATIFVSPWDDLFEDEQRRNEIYLPPDGEPAEEVFTLRVPDGYVVGEPASAGHVGSAAIDTRYETQVANGQVTMRRAIDLHPGRYDVEQYPEIRRAIRAFAGVRQQVLVLHKQ